MPSFRASLAGAAGAVALAAAPAAPAAAQTPLGWGADDEAAPSAPSESETGIAVEELGAGDPFAPSGLEPSRAALPSDLWSGSTSQDLASLFDALPGEGWSVAAAELTARALATSSSAPAGEASAEAIAAARVGALARLGRVEAVEAIVWGAIGGLENPALARHGAVAGFARGNNETACALSDGLTQGRDAPFWLRARAACAALNGARGAAELTLSLARDRGTEGVDDSFAAWVVGDLEAAAPPRDAIEVALARLAGAPLDVGLAETLTLMEAAGAALDAEAPIGLRLEAARRAAAAGAITVAAYDAALAAGAVPGERDPSALFEAALAQEGGRQAALLRQIARTPDVDPALAADAISVALDSALSAADFLLAARLYRDDLAELPRTAATVAYAPVFAEAAAAAGDASLARLWLTTRTERSGPITLGDPAPIDETELSLDPGDAAAIDVLIALADPFSDRTRLSEAALERLAVAEGRSAEETAAADRDALLLVALGATGAPLRAAGDRAVEGGATSWETLREVFAMEAAVEADALGEAVARAAIALASAEPGDPFVSASVARGLRRLGLESEARAVAIDAILVGRRGG